MKCEIKEGPRWEIYYSLRWSSTRRTFVAVRTEIRKGFKLYEPIFFLFFFKPQGQTLLSPSFEAVYSRVNFMTVNQLPETRMDHPKTWEVSRQFFLDLSKQRATPNWFIRERVAHRSRRHSRIFRMPKQMARVRAENGPSNFFSFLSTDLRNDTNGNRTAQCFGRKPSSSISDSASLFTRVIQNLGGRVNPSNEEEWKNEP